MSRDPVGNRSVRSPNSGQPVRVVIVTDVALFRDGLTVVLGTRTDIEVVSAGPPTPETLNGIAVARPAVVLVDASTVCTTHFVRGLAELDTDASPVAFAVAEGDQEEVLACAEVGVAGFVARTGTVEELVSAIHSAARGELQCSAGVAALVFGRLAVLSARRGVSEDDASLTLRESEILGLVERGRSNKEIAAQLGIEVATVKNHVHNVLKKLHVHRRGEAAAVLRSRQRWSRRPPSTQLRPHPGV